MVASLAVFCRLHFEVCAEDNDIPPSPVQNALPTLSVLPKSGAPYLSLCFLISMIWES